MISLFRIIVPFRVLLLVASETLLIFGAFVLTCYYAMETDPAVYLLYDAGLLRILLVAASILLAIHFQDLYSQIHVKSRVVLLQQLTLAIGAAFLMQGMVGYVDSDLKLPLAILGPGSAIALAALFAWRAFFSVYESKVVTRDRVLLVGGGALLTGIGGHIAAHPELGLQTAGYVRDAAGEQLPGGKALGPLSQLREIVQAVDPRRLIVDASDPGERVPGEELLGLRFAGVGVEDGVSAYERIRGRIYLGAVQLADLLQTGDLQPRAREVGFQRISGAALAVRLASPGLVFERHRRVGRAGAPFTMYRLRSKGAGAVGRAVRRLRLDALPELFNVLAGDMALVGPRPYRPEFAAAVTRWIPFYPQRQTVRPGMTGWAQIGRDASYNTVALLEYDLYYVKYMSLALDTFILFHTVKNALLSPAPEE